MSLVATKPGMTAEEFETLPDGVGYELVDGDLRARHGHNAGRSMSSLTSWVGGRLMIRLGGFVETHNLGWIFPADNGYQYFPDQPRTLRRPDVSFVKLERLKADEIRDGWLRDVPDLVVEVVSPNDLFYEVEEKIAEFRRVGVPLIWIVIPPVRSVRVIRADGSSSLIGEGEELLGEGVVPGFACRVADLFLPTAPSPAADPVG